MVGGHVGGAPAQLGGRGDGVGGDAVEIPNEAGVGGATGVEGLVGHRRLDPVTLVTRSTIMHAMQAGLTDTEAAADQGKE
uniref:Uncharacterized protein n=1 Tax=Oryza meridionalis TaxID=40149 RepID=A0A0E0DVF2_9ORYZ